MNLSNPSEMKSFDTQGCRKSPNAQFYNADMMILVILPKGTDHLRARVISNTMAMLNAAETLSPRRWDAESDICFHNELPETDDVAK